MSWQLFAQIAALTVIGGLVVDSWITSWRKK